MIFKQFFAFFFLLLLAGNPVVSAPLLNPEAAARPELNSDAAKALVHAALDAMGGEAKIRALKALRYEGVGHVFSVEQSERPEGPWIVNYLQLIETRDLSNQRVRTTTKLRNGQVSDWSENTQIVADGNAAAERAGKYFPATSLQVETANQNLALAPEKILLNALDARDLRIGPDIQLQSVRQRTVNFTWNRIPVAIYLNAETGLPTAVETINYSPFDHFWVIWGDYKIRTLYSYWTLQKGGIRYPHQWDVERLDRPYSSTTVTKLQIDPAIEERDFVIPMM